jgi:hypothetical protein
MDKKIYTEAVSKCMDIRNEYLYDFKEKFLEDPEQITEDEIGTLLKSINELLITVTEAKLPYFGDLVALIAELSIIAAHPISEGIRGEAIKALCGELVKSAIISECAFTEGFSALSEDGIYSNDSGDLIFDFNACDMTNAEQYVEENYGDFYGFELP